MTMRREPSPRAWKCWRASFQADSTDSEPPEVKNTRAICGGARARMRSVSASVAGFVAAQFG